MMAGRVARIWIDLEDVFEYAAFNPRPSGIQRVQFELCQALLALAPDRIGFLRHRRESGGFRTVSWTSVEQLFLRLRDAQPKPPRRAPVERQRLGRTLERLPLRLRVPLLQFAADQRAATIAFARLVRASLERPAPEGASEGADLETLAEPADVVLGLGALWRTPDYPARIRTVCAARGLRFGLLIHDLIPLRYPEWVEPGLARQFRAWFDPVIGLADHVLAYSEATAGEIGAYAAAHRLRLRAPVRVIPFGAGFERAAAPPATQRTSPPPGSYVLTVSTLEPRKNHVLLFRVWRRLLDDLPPDQVPMLVLVGRVGAMMADLTAQFRNCGYLDGKIMLIEDATDGELETLYRGALFTVLPSFHEGWGLPVTESLGFGVPCLAASASSLPEAGGALARYFDPDNATEAYALIRATLADRAALAAWRARIEEGFSPVPWRESAAALLEAVSA